MRILIVVPALLLVACGQPSGNVTAANGADLSEAPATDFAGPTSAPVPPPLPTYADGTQMAATVVERYFALIAAQRYAEAYALWEPGTAGMTREQFAKSFAGYADHRAEVGAPGRVDAGAGQRYVTVPVRAHGSLKAGGPFTLAGTMTLHRTADIDGATPEQRSWRIRSSDLKSRPGSAAPVAIAARYRCMDGSKLVTTFNSRRDTVTVRRGGGRLGTLSQRPAASGIWYEGGGLELRGKGDAATFTEPGKPPIACTAIR